MTSTSERLLTQLENSNSLIVDMSVSDEAASSGGAEKRGRRKGQRRKGHRQGSHRFYRNFSKRWESKSGEGFSSAAVESTVPPEFIDVQLSSTEYSSSVSVSISI